MIEDQDHSSDSTDVGIVSLGDRRRIRELETQVASLDRQLAAALDRAAPGLTRKLQNECYHHGRFEVEDHTMAVRCMDCDALMDPYVVLRKIAHREVNFCYQLNGLRDEKKRLTEEVTKLKAQRSSLRSQIKRKEPSERTT